MELKDYRISRLDDKNIVAEEYRKIISPNGTFRYDWVRLGYYGNITQALESVKKQIITKKAVELNSYKEVLDIIEKLNGAIVNCKLEASK